MQDLGFEYTLKRKGILSGLRISIRPDGEVVVTAPKILSVAAVERELWQKRDWVKKCLAKNEARQKNTAQEVQIFGKKYQKVWGSWPEEKVGVRVIGDEIKVNSPVLSGAAAVATSNNSRISPTLVEERITDFLKLTAEKYIRQRVPQLAEAMGLTGKYKRISLKKQTTRWGSCSSDKNLNFNWTLVYYPPEVIDYVLIHELSHLVHMNHSTDFWKLVERYDADYKKHRRVLNS